MQTSKVWNNCKILKSSTKFHKGSFHFGVYLCEGSQPKKFTESFCMNRFLRNNRILNSKVQWHCDPFDAIWNSQIWHTWVKDISIMTFKVFIHVTTPNIACKRKDKFFCFSYSINRFDVHILNRASDLFVFFARIYVIPRDASGVVVSGSFSCRA